MKIAVYAISKNEADFVRTFCDSAAGADLIVIADTGSTDNTVDLARACGATVHDIFISPWRFDRARDAALALLPRDVDVCVSLDLDEQLQPGWRAEIERCWTEGVTRLSYLFDCQNGIKFINNRIHARQGYRWSYPCHEALHADKRITEQVATTDRLLVTHHPDPDKSRSQYLELLAMSVAEDPACQRNAFYYARELTYYRQHENAVKALGAYLDNPKAVWAAERSAAMRMLGQAHGQLGHKIEALRWCRLACAENPGEIEPWVALASELHNQHNWTGCYAACLQALQIAEPTKTHLCDPTLGKAKAFDLASIAAYRLDRPEEALAYGQQALALSPDDERLQNNITWYTTKAQA